MIQRNEDRQIVAAQKRELRENMAARREALTPVEQEEAAKKLHVRLVPLIRQLCGQNMNPKIAVFAPFRHEIALDLVFSDLLAAGAVLCFPKTEKHLRFYNMPPGIKPAQWLRPGNFGVPEPPAESLTSQKPLNCFDLMLIPGLAFDKSGGRLGWGKAYYDQFLTALSHKPWLIGVGYTFQLLASPIPVEPHDQPLDYIVTPDCLINCRQEGI